MRGLHGWYLPPLNNSAHEEEDERGICRVHWASSLSLCYIRQIPFKVTASLYDSNPAKPASAPSLPNTLHFKSL